MKKLMAVFAVLILLLCSTALAAGPVNQFKDTWTTCQTLDASAAWVLDQEGQLFRWDYTENDPVLICSLPITNSAMFMDYEKTYPYLPEANKAQINETVNLIAADGETLYGINKFAGKIGVITADGVQWQTTFDTDCLLDGEGWERMVNDSVVMNHKFYLLLDYFEENPNASKNSRILEIDLTTGTCRLSEAVEAYHITRYNGQLLLLCESMDGSYLMQFDSATGSFERLNIPAIAGEALAYDEKTNSIYIGNTTGIYCSANGSEFSLINNNPSQFIFGSGTVTNDGRYVFVGEGIWVVDPSESSNASRMTIRLQSEDPQLRSLFIQAYPDVLLDWRTDFEMTSADVADAIRTGDTETAVFSVSVDSNFGNLVAKGFVAPITNSEIISSVNRMYPSLAAPLMNASGEVIAYPWDFGTYTWEVNQNLWNKYFPDAALPTTWKDLFVLMQAFEQVDNSEGDLFLMSWDYEFMLESVLNSYILRQNMRGEEVDFTDPVLLDTLVELNKVRELLRNRGVEYYAEHEIFWESETVGDHSLFHYGQGSATRSIYLWTENALPAFVFTQDDTPVYAGSMRVLIVNPNYENKELAEAFIAQLTKPEYSITAHYIFHADATEPYQQNHYNFTGDTIAKWQTAVSAIRLSTDDPLQSDAFKVQVRTLIERYAAGQLTDQIFLIKMNETASMVESEFK